MSSIRYALEKLDHAVGKLDSSVSSVEQALQSRDAAPVQEQLELSDAQGNVVDVDFVAKRLDKAIEAVEGILKGDE